MQQVDRFAEMLALAYNNPVVINNDVKCVQEALNAHNYGTNAKREVDLLRWFNMPEIPPIMGPAVLIDTAGVMLLWSLPEVLSSHFQDLMWGALSPINAMLSRSVSEPTANGTWRIAHRNFDGADMQGCLNFSPAWFQQGRNASTACPEVSATLKARNPDQGGRDWLKQMMVPSAVLSAAMAIMHSDLYTAGRKAVIHLYQDLAMPHSDDPAFAEMAEMLRLAVRIC
ncbi:hypothetical protein PAXRUDRAFT_22102 [Paxillus rubicundulus Ve08.2h10]|uniref:Uncharacterized protein n=1 Tax=Paxillus rubicundulus Ve08.2h10 TaxID=930991 RepID=A0A0D0D645_9AGAM|nr:hypothetical protein PAXRUDRAFT_22102 [Paxillus rubicundulus Ve08.2h10]